MRRHLFLSNCLTSVVETRLANCPQIQSPLYAYLRRSIVLRDIIIHWGSVDSELAHRMALRPPGSSDASAKARMRHPTLHFHLGTLELRGIRVERIRPCLSHRVVLVEVVVAGPGVE